MPGSNLLSANLYLDVRVEVAGDTGRGPVLGGLEGHTVDAGDELVRRIEEGADATISISQATKIFIRKQKQSEYGWILTTVCV